MYIQWNIIRVLKKGENPAFAIVEAATLEKIMLIKNKPDAERQILHDPTYMRYLPRSSS